MGADVRKQLVDARAEREQLRKLSERLHRANADLKARVAALEAERDEARRLAEEACERHNALLADQRILRCAFCGHEYPPGTPPTQHETLTAHVMECPKHPLRAANAELRAAMRAELRPDDGSWVANGPSERFMAALAPSAREETFHGAE